MSLRELLASGRIRRHKATAEEVRRLFGVVARDLADARVEGLSEDRRFAIAYNAALQAGRALLAAEGYRTVGQGHHHTVFESLRHVLDEEHRHVLDYLDDCRSKKNVAEYLGAEVTSVQEAAELVREAGAFAELVQGLIRRRHPRLAK